MRIFKLLIFCGIIFLGASCTSQRKATNNYLQNVADTVVPIVSHIPDPVIQQNDILSIKVYSMSINPATDLPYNLPDQTLQGSSGFLVDKNGNIEYPRIGPIHAEGLTKEQLADSIKAKLEGQLTQPSVIVRFLNYRFTVLGEVGSSGTFTVPIDKVTILEALGLAGGITEFGKRDKVKVLREANGQREVATIDLTSKDMFNSPFYYLRQNDVIMVEQTSKKIKQQDRQELRQEIAIATSIITAIALILNFIK